MLQPIKGVGKGAYGVVCSARVAGSTDKVAIKKIQNAFENETDARRTLREVTLLRQLHHENVIKLKDIMQPPGSSREHFRDVYLVYELMDTDLHQIIRSKQPLSDEHFQYFLYQVCILVCSELQNVTCAAPPPQPRSCSHGGRCRSCAASSTCTARTCCIAT